MMNAIYYVFCVTALILLLIATSLVISELGNDFRKFLMTTWHCTNSISKFLKMPYVENFIAVKQIFCCYI